MGKLLKMELGRQYYICRVFFFFLLSMARVVSVKKNVAEVEVTLEREQS